MRQHAAGQGPGGTRQQDAAGPAGEGVPAQGVCSIEAGNAALPEFVAAYNARFAKAASDARDMHRPIAGTDDLDTAFSWQEERTVSGSLTLQYEKALFLLQPSELTRSLARKRVTVHDFPDGRLEIRHGGQALPYLVFDKGRQMRQGSVVANKNLGAAMTAIKAKQARRGTMIAGSLAALAPTAGTPLPDRLWPRSGLCANATGANGEEAARRHPPGPAPHPACLRHRMVALAKNAPSCRTTLPYEAQTATVILVTSIISSRDQRSFSCSRLQGALSSYIKNL